jgi:hypothetical protein
MAILPIGETPNLYECCYRSMKSYRCISMHGNPKQRSMDQRASTAEATLNSTRQELFEALNQQIGGRFEASSWLL